MEDTLPAVFLIIVQLKIEDCPKLLLSLVPGHQHLIYNVRFMNESKGLRALTQVVRGDFWRRISAMILCIAFVWRIELLEGKNGLFDFKEQALVEIFWLFFYVCLAFRHEKQVVWQVNEKMTSGLCSQCSFKHYAEVGYSTTGRQEPNRSEIS